MSDISKGEEATEEDSEFMVHLLSFLSRISDVIKKLIFAESFSFSSCT